MSEPLVTNAADRQQVKRATQRKKDERRYELADLLDVLALPAGRRVLWRVLTHCKVFESIYAPDVRIYANSGRQDVGHWLMAELEQANPEAIFQLMVEHRQREQRESDENLAAHVAGAPSNG